MTAGSVYRLRLLAALALSVGLVSCSSAPQVSPPPSESAAPRTADPSREPSLPEEFVSATDPVEARGSVSPATSEPDRSSKPPGDKAAESAEPPVEISSNKGNKPAPQQPPAKPAFQPKSPSLANLKLGTSDKEVVKLYGPPDEAYPLPGDGQTIDIWAYDGLSVGLNEKNKVVFVEILSGKADTGVAGLRWGMKGSEAAALLGIDEDDATNVIALEVGGGWIKLDLDPDTRKVLSLKLLSGEL